MVCATTVVRMCSLAFVFPAIGLQAAINVDEAAFLEVVQADVGQLAPGVDQKPVGAILFLAGGRLPGVVDGQGEGGILLAVGGETRLRVTSQIPDELHTIE